MREETHRAKLQVRAVKGRAAAARASSSDLHLGHLLGHSPGTRGPRLKTYLNGSVCSCNTLPFNKEFVQNKVAFRGNKRQSFKMIFNDRYNPSVIS